MHISSITASNLKGRSFSIDLAPATFIHGPNFAGKTAIATALRLGLAGFLPPPIGKAAGSIYNALAGNPDEAGHIEIKVDAQGRGYTTRWIRNSRGGTSVQGGVPPIIAMPAVLVDPRTFFSMTGPQRVQAIFEACEVSLTAESVATALKGAALSAFPVQRRNQILTELGARAKAQLAAKSPQVAMADLIEETRARLKETKDKAKTQSAIIQAINWEGDVPEDVSLQIEEANARLAQISATAGALAERVKAVQRRKAEKAGAEHNIASLESEIAVTRWDAAPVKPDTSALEGMEERIAEARRVIDANKVRRQAIEKQIKALAGGHCPTCGTTGEFLESAIAGLKASLDALPKEMPPADLFDLVAQASALRKSREEYQSEFAKYQKDTEFCELAQRQIEAQRAILTASDPEPPSPDELKSIEEERERLTSTLALYREHAAKWEAYQQTGAKREEAERYMAALNCEALVLDDAVRVLRAKVAETADAAFARTLAVTQKFTDGLLNSPLEYRDELGRRVSPADIARGCTAPVGAWISHESFSGTEEAIAYAAFAVAIAMRAPLKVVILDELGRLDADTKRRTVERMVQLVESRVIDQFVGIDTEPVEGVGIYTVDLGALRGEARVAEPCLY